MDRLPAERALAEHLSAYPLRVRRLMVEVLTVRDDAERAKRVGELHVDPRSRSFAEILIDAEEDLALRAVLVGMLRELQRG